MAVRNFEMAPWTGRVVEPVPAPLRRRSRRSQRRWAATGVLAVMVPFIAALVVLGVVR